MKKLIFLITLNLISFCSLCQISIDDPFQFNTYESEYQAVINQAVSLGYTLPSVEVQQNQNNLVIRMKAAGIWTQLDVFYNFVNDAPNGDFARINWITPASYLATAVNTPIWSPGQGFKGDGSGTIRHLDTNWSPKTDGVNYTLNSAGAGCYATHNLNTNTFLFGSFDAGTTNGLYLAPRNVTNNISYRVNMTTVDNSASNTDGSSAGFWHLKRTAAGATSLYKNGRSEDTGTVASTDRPTDTMKLLAISVGGVTSTSTARNIMMFWAGASLNGLESTWNNIWSKYLSNSYSVLDHTGHCWFARPAAVYSAAANKTFLSQVHNKDNAGFGVSICQVDHSNGGNISSFRLSSVNEWDDHNECTVLIRSSDSKLFTCYSEHSGPAIRYRISTNATDATAWGAQTSINPGWGKYTYPSCFEDASGKIWIFFRDDQAASPFALKGWSYVNSSDGGVTFGNYSLFFFGNVTRGYLTSYQDPNNKDIIHFIGSGGHPVDAQAVNLYHFYLDCSTSTLHKSDGTDVTANKPLTGTTGMTQIMSNTLPDTGWLEDIIVDSSGKPRVLMTHFPNGKNTTYLVKDLYYSEWTGSAWTTPYKIHEAMSGYIASANTTPPVDPNISTYPPKACFNVLNPDEIFAGKKTGLFTEIFKITRVNSGSFTSEQKTFNSLFNQWRPISTGNPNKNVVWLNSVLYPDYTSYTMQLCLGQF